MKRIALSIALMCAFGTTVTAREPDRLLKTPLAAAFGSTPAMWGLRLSPDGTKISYLQTHPEGITIGTVLDVSSRNVTLIIASDPERFTVTWCDWANNSRLLCGLRAPLADAGTRYATTRLVAVNADGTDLRTLLAEQLDYELAQFQDNVLDWLPSDEDHVLVQEPSNNGSGVARLNIYDGRMSTTERNRQQVYRWISDGNGTPRLFVRTTASQVNWYARDTSESNWQVLRETEIGDLEDDFDPVGFGVDARELLYFDTHEGRNALYGLNLRSDESRLIFAHETHDVVAINRLGRENRLVSAIYIDDRPHGFFFDERVAEIRQMLEAVFPDQIISIVEEDWEQRFYLLTVSSDRDPGTYYRFDSVESTLLSLSPAYPSLDGIELAPMREIRYSARDGALIPAYLTVSDSNVRARGAIVLPHGGPSARDYWSYDFLAQFFAANGYAVLQSNYRGSSGYGAAWEGDGAFQGWRQAVADINDGARYLVENDIAAAERICIVGWSFGGFAALMSTIESPALYQCAASIAGVTDPKSLGSAMRRFVGGRAAQLFIGLDDEIVRAGSPLERAEEINVPILLVHAEEDMNVPFRQSQDMAKALRRAGADYEFIEYEFAEHNIWPPRYRTDLLTRLNAFVSRHIMPED